MKLRSMLVGALALCAVVAAGCDKDATKNDPVGTKKNPTELTFLTYGPASEVNAFKSTVEDFNLEHPTVRVKVQSAPDRDAALRYVESGKKADVFLMSRRDLGTVVDQELNQPLEELLDSRDVDFGDGYKRDARLAFSSDSHQQCMPYGVSPMVMYYNTDLIDFDAMAEEGLEVPGGIRSYWNFDQFTAAATQATQPGVKGVYISPSVIGTAPFILSGGGRVFDDDLNPTQLEFSDDNSRESLDQLLTLLRTERVSPTPGQIRKESAVERFKNGKVAMIAGFRSLTPELRKEPTLNFDVISMPTIDTKATVGDVSGLCMSADAASSGAAADLIVHLISKDSVEEVAEAGYLVPSNNEVSESDAFLQPGRQPEHANVFNRAGFDIRVLPLIPSWEELDLAVRPYMNELFYDAVVDPDELTTEIDEASKEPLVPMEERETESPSDGSSSGTSEESDQPSDGNSG